MRDTLLALPGWEGCWETVVAVAVAVAVGAAAVGVTWDTLMVLYNVYTLGYPDGFIQCICSWIP